MRESHGTDDNGRWVGDRNGRKVRAGDLVDVPHEGEQVVTELDLRDCGEDDGRTGLPTVSFKIGSDLPGVFGWEYADAVSLVRSKSR